MSLGIASDYIPIDMRKVEVPEVYEVRTRQERFRYSKEIGVGMYFFVANGYDRRIRIMEILGKGDLRVGYKKLTDMYPKAWKQYKIMFNEIRENNNGHNFCRYLSRDTSFLSATEASLKKAGGIRTYRSFVSARMVMKRYEEFK